MRTLLLLIGAGLAAAVAGGLSAVAIGGISQGEPTQTVTIDVATGPRGATGPQGIPGPQGPAGPAGTVDCGPGFTWSLVVINAPNGQKKLKACAENE